jgi:glutamate/tyrosine decarboxylase-like PLP-dependent enzyme
MRMMDSAGNEGGQRLLEQIVSLAQALRDERERLARRLAALEPELCVLASKLDGEPTAITLGSHRS